MTKEEVEVHRDLYSAMYRAKPDASPWKKSFEGMGQKTVIKALFRNVTISADLDRAVGADDAEELREPVDITGSSEIIQAMDEAETEPTPAPAKTDKEEGDLF